MNTHIILTSMAFAMMLPGTASAQYTKPLPESIREIRLEDYSQLTVRQGDSDRLEMDTKEGPRELAKVSGSRLTITENAGSLTLYLRPDRSMGFNTQDFSALTFEGDFALRDSLMLHSEDFSRINYNGAAGDTLRARLMMMTCEDYSHIATSQPVQYGLGRYTAIDYSHLDLAASDMQRALAPDGVGDELYTNSDFGRINSGRHTVDGELKAERTEYDGDEVIAGMEKLTTGVGDIMRKVAKKKQRHPWHTDWDLAFGWHNWGDQIGNGLGGVESDAAVGTTLNNWQLAVNVPLVNTRGFAIKLGLGLEWDTYRFIASDVSFDPTAAPMGFVQGNNAAYVGNSRLKTRYVVVPVKFEFGNPKRWHVNLTALPGIGWTGKNTGLRRQYHYTPVEAETREKDYSVNKYLNPYKLDLRLAVKYDNIGAYIQVATLSALKGGCDELFPVKFGIIL